MVVAALVPELLNAGVELLLGHLVIHPQRVVRIPLNRQFGAIVLGVAVLQPPGRRSPVVGAHGVGDGAEIGDHPLASRARNGVKKLHIQILLLLTALATLHPVVKGAGREAGIVAGMLDRRPLGEGKGQRLLHVSGQFGRAAHALSFQENDRGHPREEVRGRH